MVILTKGLQGSGKSTWAKAWVEESPKTRIRINRDDLRRMLGPYWIPSREFLITEIEHSILETALDEGFDIVIDNMNLNASITNDYIKIIEESDTMYTFKEFLDVDVETCIERDKQREHSVGEEVIRKTHLKYSHLFEK